MTSDRKSPSWGEMNEITSSDEVECTECGHVVEQHDTKGCQGTDGCTCRVPWTQKAIGDLRVSLGLPRRWGRRS